jgi:hypothetical protein
VKALCAFVLVSTGKREELGCESGGGEGGGCRRVQREREREREREKREIKRERERKKRERERERKKRERARESESERERERERETWGAVLVAEPGEEGVGHAEDVYDFVQRCVEVLFLIPQLLFHPT